MFALTAAAVSSMFMACEKSRPDDSIDNGDGNTEEPSDTTDTPADTVFYKIIVNAGENGDASADVDEAQAGETVTLTAVPDEGYEFTGWTIDGLEEYGPMDNPLTFTMPENDVTASAAFGELVNILDEMPDEAFRYFIKEHMWGFTVTNPITGEEETEAAWDSNVDGILTPREAASARFMVQNGYYTSGDSMYEEATFSDLTGIEYFTGLEILSLTVCTEELYEVTVDLSGLKSLKYLDLTEASTNDFTLVLGEDKPELRYLYLDGCWLDELVLTGYPRLEVLNIDRNDFETVDFSACTELRELTIGALTSLDLSKNTKIVYLDVTDAALKNWIGMVEGPSLDCVDISGIDAAEDYEIRLNKYYGGQYYGGSNKIIMRQDQKDWWDANLANNTFGSTNYTYNVDVEVEIVG